MQRERMTSRRKRKNSRNQRKIRQTTACRERGWQAGGRGELAEIRWQIDRLRNAERRWKKREKTGNRRLQDCSKKREDGWTNEDYERQREENR
jgi:hypothetical protein